MSSHLTQHLSKLTGSRAVKEPAIQTALQTVLEGFEAEPEVIREYQTGDGPCDLFLPARRVVIETKERSGKGKAPTAGPNLPGSKEGETQFQQLERYVLALRQKEQATLWGMLADNDTGWVGALTDGAHWWAWEWPTSDQGSFARPFPLLHEQSFDGTPEALYEALEALATRKAGKLWVPANPADLFKPLGEQLTEVWAGAASNPSAETQHRLWDDLIRGSGIEVAEHRRVSLFLDHCLLVVLARDVTRVLDNSPYLPPSDGFVSWIADAPGGAQWASELFKVVDRYDWGSREADVLRNVYMEIVPKADRKLYGEYYTPDWLAHLIVEETLDEEWLKNAILAAHSAGVPPEGVGVLDPTCGSGTFLFHAARRIAAAIPKYLPSSDPEARAKITSHLVHGIDIHPIAVEMSRATLRRALPAAAEPSVHQGDALLMSDTSAAGLTGHIFNPEQSEFVSPDARHRFHVPHDFTEFADFPKRLDDLVQAARDGVGLPATVTLGMNAGDAAWVRDAHESLTKMIDAHGDGVWAWYIRNQLMPRAIARRKVDRIVANPPWLRWNEIQTEPRKGNVRKLAEARDLLSPKQGGRTSFDMAAIFVVETRHIYLARSDTDASAYVLNAAALRAENWRHFREQGHASGGLDLTSKHLDGLILLKRPFHGAEACVIGLRHSGVRRLVLRDASKKIEPGMQGSPAALARRLLPVEPFPWESSRYEPRPRQGATIGPAILVRVDPNDPDVTFQPKRATPPWSRYSPFSLDDIPRAWRLPYVRSGDFAPYQVKHPSIAIVPNDSGRLLTDEEAAQRSGTWRKLTQTYQSHVGRGETTPKTLAGLLNFRDQLVKQWPLKLSVLYNKSGQNLRAATASTLVNDTVYRIAVDSREEGDFLAAWLNSPALRAAFQLARSTDRDFHKTPLAKVPVPVYNPADAEHQQITVLSAAIRTRRAERPLAEYPNAFRDELDPIDALVRRLLPEFCR